MSNLDIAKKFINLGGNEWKKGGHYRVYIDGHIAKKFFDDEHAYFGSTHKIYFNALSGEFGGNYKSGIENLNILLNEAVH